ncbi:MAG: AAA family ATPase [Candidatus Riflebacteria bacterium]|nr:AAA family ATPase [Candidatus Riflebacteria bacterium]
MLEVKIADLPKKLTMFEAVENCYTEQIRFVWSRLREGVSVMVRCEKQIIPYLQGILKKRLTTDGKNVTFIDGRPPAGSTDSPPRVIGMVNQLRSLVNNTEPNKVFFLSYLDIITSTAIGGLSQEAKEIMTIIHENPLLVLATFEDPDFPIPELIGQAFPARAEMLGLPRARMAKLLTAEEARKFTATDPINLMSLYKFVSGLNPVRFREIMGIFARKTDLDPKIPDMLANYLNELRGYTACAGASLSHIHLDRDIAGYPKVKQQIRDNILNLLQRANQAADEKEVRQLETIIPKGLIFHGPPGTGKTLFAKGIAEALNAAIYIVSGPELKSKWVGEGEANIRRLFARARATAPAVIVFDELDSIAAQRTGNTGDGGTQAAHSMVNQLLTEMDGFRKEQLVLVIGTTNFLSCLDPAFLRPGRFEYQIEIPYPEWEDRRAILDLYNRGFETGLTADDLDLLAGWTSRLTDTGTPHTGDHLNALMRNLKRWLINHGRTAIDDASLKAWLKELEGGFSLTPEEERVVAIHECGHALLYRRGNRHDEIRKVTLEGGGGGTLGLVESKARRPNAFFTESRLRNDIAICLGGYAAEKLVFGEISTGASADLQTATRIASDMVAVHGMGGQTAPRFLGGENQANALLMGQASARVDVLLAEALVQATRFLEAHRDQLDRLADLLIEKRTLTPEDLAAFFRATEAAPPGPATPAADALAARAYAPADPAPAPRPGDHHGAGTGTGTGAGPDDGLPSPAASQPRPGTGA